jgi:creatinine amidohydrolase
MRIRFDELRSPEIAELAGKQGMVIVPIGACEEHSRHLPVCTDTRIAEEASLAAAREVADRIPLAVLPAIWFGYTVAALKKWPGTITVRPKVMIDVVYDICRSLIDMDLGRILIVNSHGNNPGFLDVAVRSVADDFGVYPGVVHTYACWDAAEVGRLRRSAVGGISHAGEAETSMMRYLTDLVEMSEAVADDAMMSDLETCPLDACAGRKKLLHLSTWFLEDSRHGGCGDPTPATAEFGEQLLAMTVRSLVKVIDEFYTAQTGGTR